METEVVTSPNGEGEAGPRKRTMSPEARANISAGIKRSYTKRTPVEADPMEQTAVDLVRLGRRVLARSGA